MFELLIIFLAVVIVIYSQLGAWSYAVLFFAIVLALPGMYAMWTVAPYVPTDKRKMDRIIQIISKNKNVKIVDLGCGDGRVVRSAAKIGVKRAVGYEFSFLTYLFAKIWTFFAKDGGEIYFGDMWKQDYKEFDVLICFLLKDPMKRFENEVWPQLNLGTIVISNAFKIPGIEPDSSDRGVHVYTKK